MPDLLIKPAPDEDFYVIWTTVADGPIKYGTRAELSQNPSLPEFLKSVMTNQFPILAHVAEEAFNRADSHGSSYLNGNPSWYDWDTTETLLYISDTDDFTLEIPRNKFVQFFTEYQSIDIPGAVTDVTPAMAALKGENS